MATMPDTEADAPLVALQLQHESLRARLARELHGELGSTLVAARLALAGVPSVTDAAREDALAAVDRLLVAALEAQRAAVEALRPALFDHFGIGPALKAQVESLCQSAQLACEPRIDDPLPLLSADAAILLYRFAETALAVVVAAGVRQVVVELGSREGGCELRIAPDGEVPLPEWQGLSAWVAALGGRIESGRGAGWLRVLLPAAVSAT